MEQKTKVQKLTSHDLNFFTSTNLNLNELYKLKDMMRINRTFVEHTYNNLAIIENVPNIVEATTNSTIDAPIQSVITPSISNVNDAPCISNQSDKSNNRSDTGVDTDRDISNGNLAKINGLNALDELDP